MIQCVHLTFCVEPVIALGWTAVAWPDKESSSPVAADGPLAVPSVTNDVLIKQSVYWGILSVLENQQTEVVEPWSLRVGANQGRCSLLSVAPYRGCYPGAMA